MDCTGGIAGWFDFDGGGCGLAGAAGGCVAVQIVLIQAEIAIHGGADAVYSAAGGVLPEGVGAGVVGCGVVPGQPDVTIEGGGLDIIPQPVIAAVVHGGVTGCLDLLEKGECQGSHIGDPLIGGREGGECPIQTTIVTGAVGVFHKLRVKDQGEGDIIPVDQIKDVLRFFPGLILGDGLREYIDTDL